MLGAAVSTHLQIQHSWGLLRRPKHCRNRDSGGKVANTNNSKPFEVIGLQQAMG